MAGCTLPCPAHCRQHFQHLRTNFDVLCCCSPCVSCASPWCGFGGVCGRPGILSVSAVTCQYVPAHPSLQGHLCLPPPLTPAPKHFACWLGLEASALSLWGSPGLSLCISHRCWCVGSPFPPHRVWGCLLSCSPQQELMGPCGCGLALTPHMCCAPGAFLWECSSCQGAQLEPATGMK